MSHYERFIFESYALDQTERRIELCYSLDGKLKFTETLILPPSLKLDMPPTELDAALFALHLAGGISYYKTYLPKTIEIASGQLSASAATFWDQLYQNGLGEFFYRNQIDFRGLIRFPALGNEKVMPNSKPRSPRRVLVPFGGGKDSLVTAEILKDVGVDQTLFRVRSHPLITALAKTAELPLLEIERTLDPKLADLNNSGAYNGHVPVTAYISFLSVVTALLGEYDAVVFSNERSSSYGNVEYLGMTINHQWSKSVEFEKLIRQYIHTEISREVAYLNPLRPLSELKIAALFAGYPQYYDKATSCNRNWTLSASMPTTQRWCGRCPKCAFSFALFAAFIPAPNLITMFGQNLFANAQLLPLYRELWGQEGFKPFECVGTPEETKLALYLAAQTPAFTATPIMTAFCSDVLPAMKDSDEIVSELMKKAPVW